MHDPWLVLAVISRDGPNTEATLADGRLLSSVDAALVIRTAAVWGIDPKAPASEVTDPESVMPAEALTNYILDSYRLMEIDPDFTGAISWALGAPERSTEPGDLWYHPGERVWRAWNGEAWTVIARDKLPFADPIENSYTGEHEQCGRCGNRYRVVWAAPDDLWNSVEGSPSGKRCPECFVLDCEAWGIYPFFVAHREHVKVTSEPSAADVETVSKSLIEFQGHLLAEGESADPEPLLALDRIAGYLSSMPTDGEPSLDAQIAQRGREIMEHLGNPPVTLAPTTQINPDLLHVRDWVRSASVFGDADWHSLDVAIDRIEGFKAVVLDGVSIEVAPK